jgi:hypothetical protein
VYGAETHWHRVVKAGGWPAPGHEREALVKLRKDRTPMHSSGERVDLAQARWDGTPPPQCEDLAPLEGGQVFTLGG